MEMYQLIATIVNTSTSYTLVYLPENFKGLKITQNFSFINPIGYTPKYSIDTMRIIRADKTTFDAVFDTYGLQANITIQIKKLNATGIGYTHLAYFSVDFESYEKFDVYSEFALKSVSVIDKYNLTKNNEVQVELSGTNSTSAPFPTTQKFINFVSLKSEGFFGTTPYFAKNNDAKIYNSDTSLFTPVTGADGRTIIYRFGADNLAASMYVSISGNLFVTDTNGTLKLAIYKGSAISGVTKIYEFTNDVVVSTGTDVVIDIAKTLISLGDCYEGDELLIQQLGTTFTIEGDLFLDMTLQTSSQIVTNENETLKCKNIFVVLCQVFNQNVFTPDIDIPFTNKIFDFALTSANQIMKLSTFANIKPKEFLSDLCLMGGLLVNFKTDGKVEIANIADYFNDLLVIGNATEIVNFKDLSVKYNTSLNFSSVSVGQEISDYDMYSYFINWNKILTFKQDNRIASESLELSLSKLRGDFSGMLDYFYKRSTQTQKVSKDNFIFDPLFGLITGTDASIKLYDNYTPRDILINWSKYLSFCFQNFGLTTLTIASNGGNVDDLQISSVDQMDNFTLSETVKILPIEYNFTALIDFVDFSDNILKINYNNEDIYLFVINSETTDQLNQQKITALKIEL